MPILPRVEPTQVQVGVPRGPRENAFTEIGKGLGEFAQVFDEMKKQDDVLWLNKAHQDFLLKSDANKDAAAQEESDPVKRLALYQQKQDANMADIYKTAPSTDARRLATEHIGMAATRDYINYKADAAKGYRDEQIAKLDVQEQGLANQLASEPDAQQREQLRNTHVAALSGLTAGRFPVLTKDQAVKRLQSLDSETERARGMGMISSDADSFIQAVNGGGFDKLKPEVKQQLLDTAFKARDSQYTQADHKMTALHNVVMDNRRRQLQAGQVTNGDIDGWMNLPGPLGLSGEEAKVMKGDLASGPAAGRDPTEIQSIRTQFAIDGDGGIGKALQSAQKYVRSNPLDPAGPQLLEQLRSKERGLRSEARGDVSNAKNVMRSAVQAHTDAGGKTLYDWFNQSSPVESALGIKKREKLANVLIQADDKINKGMNSAEATQWAVDQLTKEKQNMGVGQLLRPETQKYLNGGQ